MKPGEEKLQPVPSAASFEWTETSMFGFNIPEHGIDAIVYFWMHPTFKVAYGGISIWRGVNDNQIAAAYTDYRMVMPMPEDITDCTYANGVRVKMIAPREEFEVSFDDPSSETWLRLHLKATMPPACRHNGGHITQLVESLSRGGNLRNRRISHARQIVGRSAQRRSAFQARAKAATRLWNHHSLKPRDLRASA